MNFILKWLIKTNMTLIKTFKLRNKLEIDVLVNDELLLTITRPISRTEKNDLNDINNFDLLDGSAEMYRSIDPDKQNSFIYYTSSCGNQMALILTESEAKDFLKLTYENDTEFDTESYTESDTDPTETKQSEELEKRHEELKQSKYTKGIILDRKNHPTDVNLYIYIVDFNLSYVITCVSENFYKIGDLVNVYCYKNYFKGIYSEGILSQNEIQNETQNESKKETQNETKKEPEKINSRFASWFGF